MKGIVGVVGPHTRGWIYGKRAVCQIALEAEWNTKMKAPRNLAHEGTVVMAAVPASAGLAAAGDAAEGAALGAGGVGASGYGLYGEDDSDDDLVVEAGAFGPPFGVGGSAAAAAAAASLGSGMGVAEDDGAYVVQASTSVGLPPAVQGSLAYLTFIGGAIVLSTEKKNLFCVFHGWQSFCVGSVWMVLAVFSSPWAALWKLVLAAYALFSLAMVWRVGNDAPSQRLFKISRALGDWCEERAGNKLQFHSGSRHSRAAGTRYSSVSGKR